MSPLSAISSRVLLSLGASEGLPARVGSELVCCDCLCSAGWGRWQPPLSLASLTEASPQPRSRMGHTAVAAVRPCTGQGWLCKEQILLSRDSIGRGREVILSQGLLHSAPGGPAMMRGWGQCSSAALPSMRCAVPEGSSAPLKPWQAVS